jgi:apolipoprotein N-acyltransferase
MSRRSIVQAAASGLLLAATFPTVGLWPLAWFALVPLFLALKHQTLKNGFLIGGTAGLVFFAGTVYWVTNSVHFYGNVPLIPASLITLLLCAYLALYPAFFGLCVSHLQRHRQHTLFLAAPAIWTALELARTYVFSGFPWALLGYSQHTFLPVIQISDVTGVYGVSFLIVFVNAGVSEIVLGKRRFMPVVVAASVTLLVVGYGYFRLHTTEQPGGLKISVIQGNIEQDKKWDPAYQQQTIAAYKRLTVLALAQHPDLVIWPETSTPFYYDGQDPREQQLSADLRAFVKANQVPLLFGSPTYEIRRPRNVLLRNSAFLLNGDGELAAKYDKFHLVPFGEYVPLKSVLFFVEKMVQAIGDFTTGTDFTVMAVKTGRSSPVETNISTVICYEIIFPDLVRRFVDRGAGIITTITNDAWFGKTSAPYQHFSMAVFRAVENRVPVARAANTGVSGFVDSRGRIIAASPIFTEAYMTKTLKPGVTKTFYTCFGDVFSYLCCIISIIVLVPSKDRSKLT